MSKWTLSLCENANLALPEACSLPACCHHVPEFSEHLALLVLFLQFVLEHSCEDLAAMLLMAFGLQCLFDQAAIWC